MRERRLKRIEVVIEWQQGMPAKSDHDRLLLDRQHCRRRLFGPVGRSATERRFFHLATVFGLIPWRRATVLRLS